MIAILIAITNTIDAIPIIITLYIYKLLYIMLLSTLYLYVYHTIDVILNCTNILYYTALGTDVASSEFYVDGKYDLNFKSRTADTKEPMLTGNMYVYVWL